MKVSCYSGYLKWALLAQVSLYPGIAFAQTAPIKPGQVGSAAGTNEASGEIIVTAQRRSESLQKVPLTVSVVSADAIAKRNITTESDLQFATPGLTVRTGSTSNEVNYAIRGQSVDQYSGTTPGVLPYINDVQISNDTGGGAGTTAFYDLQSIQVLKGPQGTLFGRNSTGGAVLFTTTKPGDKFGGYINALAGDYRTAQVEGAVDVPIVQDKLLARVSGFYGHRRGYQFNYYDDSHPGTDNRYGGRISVTAKPFEGLQNDFVFDYYHIGGSSEQGVLNKLDDIPGATNPALFYSPTYAGWNAYLATHTNPSLNPAGLAAYVVEQAARGPFKIATNDTNLFRGTNRIVTNTTAYDLGTNTVLKNIFGYGRLTSKIEGDSDGTPYGIAGDGAPAPGNPGGQVTETLVSDELQLSGKTLGNNLTYATGLYYSYSKAHVRRQTNFFDIFDAPDGVNDDEARHTNYAVYGQGTYDLSELTKIQGLNVTGGLRYNNEKTQRMTLPGDEAYGDALAAPALYNNNQSEKIGNLSWTVGAQEQFNANFQIYVTGRRSYKNGGFNANLGPRVGLAATGGDGYSTEKITDIEVGSKFSGQIQGVPLQLDIALFNDWIDNSQQTAFATIDGSPSAITVNVPKGKNSGVEASGQIKPVPWLSLGGSLNYIDARYTSQVAEVLSQIETFTTVPDTPKWSGTLFGVVTAPLNNNVVVNFRTELFAQTRTFFTSQGGENPSAHIDGYKLVNFQLGLDDDANGLSFSLNLKNAFNKVYYVGGLPLATTLDINTVVPGAPRTFSVAARYKF